MKIRLLSLLLMLFPAICLASDTNNITIGVSPGVIETEMLAIDQIERQITLMRSPLDHDESYTVSIDGDNTVLTIHVPDNLLLPSGQQQIEFPLIINTTNASLGTYDATVTFTPNQPTTTLINASATEQKIAFGITAKIQVTVVPQLTPAVESTTGSNNSLQWSTVVWLISGIICIVVVGIVLILYHRKKQNK